MRTPPTQMPALTGLRAAAALAIVLFHYGGQLVAWAPPWVNAVRVGGYVWVGLFFVLSGFVLGSAHAGPLDGSARRAFWAARAARLYPAYLVALVLSAPGGIEAAARLGVARAATSGLASVALVQAWFPPIAFSWNSPGWSTSVIAAFYAVFPFAAARLGKLSTPHLRAAAAISWCASLAFPAAWLALEPDGPVTVFTELEPPWLLALKFHPVPRAGEFVTGVALGLLHRRGALQVPASAAAPSLLLVAVVLATGAIPFVLLHNGLLVPLFALVIAGLARGGSHLATALSARPVRALGEASFALYALQEPIYRIARAMPGAPRHPKPGFLLLYLLATCLAAIAMTRLVEAPIRRAFRPRPLSADPPAGTPGPAGAA